MSRFRQGLAFGVLTVGLALTAHSALAAPPTLLRVSVTPPSTLTPTCDLLNSCSLPSLTQSTSATSSRSGSSTASFSVDIAQASVGPSAALVDSLPQVLHDEFVGTQLCYPVIANSTQITLTPLASDPLGSHADLALTSLCFSGGDATGDVIGEFILTSGSGVFDLTSTQSRAGWFSGVYGGQDASLGSGTPNQVGLALSTFNLPTAPVVPPCPSTDPACTVDPGTPPPGGTPELDTLVLFGSGLLGGATYLWRRMRSRR